MVFVTACVSPDLSAVIKLNIGLENIALSYAHSFSLQSPTFPAPQSEMCLTVEYTSEAELTVRIICMSDSKVNDTVLRRSSLQLGYELHRMNLIIPGKGVQNDSCVLIFDISTTKSGFLAAISSVTMTEGKCIYPGLFLFPICYFYFFD